jgi:hypothetical protein
MSNLEEFRAGTSPIEAASALRVEGVRHANGGVTIRFRTVAGKAYRLECCLSLARLEWSPVVNNIPGTGAIVEVRDAAVPSARACFYRVRLVP